MDDFYDNEWQRAAGNFNKRRHSGFMDKKDFADWFVSALKKQDNKCYYCETSIQDINRLIDANLLTERETGFGWRGRILEIDKNDRNYSKDGCVLSCLYCNNDKSYTTTKEAYKEYFGPNRKKYFQILLSKLNNS